MANKKLIFNAISSLILEDGIENVTFSHIGDKIGKTKNSIFYYFSTKDIMLMEYTRYFNSVHKMPYKNKRDEYLSKKDLHEALQKSLQALYYSYDYYDKNDHIISRELLSLCQTNPDIYAYYKEIETRVLAIFEHDLRFLMEKGIVKEDIDVKKCANELLFDTSALSLLYGSFIFDDDAMHEYAIAKAFVMLEKLEKKPDK